MNPYTDPPPAGEHVLAFVPGLGWWQAQYCPEEGEWRGYDPDAWHFIELGPCVPSGEVTHWLPMPPDPVTG